PCQNNAMAMPRNRASRSVIQQWAVSDKDRYNSICYSQIPHSDTVLPLRNATGKTGGLPCKFARNRWGIASRLVWSILPTGSGNGGVIKMLRFTTLLSSAALALGLVSAASAADLRPAYKAPAPVAAPMPYSNWSGFYIGGHAGAGWSEGSDSAFIGGG